MIEKEQFTITRSGSNDVVYSVAKTIAEMIVDKFDNVSILAEYKDGYVLQIDDNLFGVYGDYTSPHCRTTVAVLKQKNDTLSESLSDTTITTDYTTIHTSYFSTTITNAGSAYEIFVEVTFYSNNKDVILCAGTTKLLFNVHDEDGERYAGTSISYVYSSDGNIFEISPILNTSAYLRRTNGDEIFMVPTFLKTPSQLTKYMKNVYNILKSDNVVTNARYKFDGYEYLALTDVILFRLEGGD